MANIGTNQIRQAIARPVTCPEIAAMSSELIELGHQALASVSKNIAGGAPLLKCKLVASEFYEALRHELNKPASGDSGDRSALIAAANQCDRIAIAIKSPHAMLGELKRAVDLLTAIFPTEPPSMQARPRPVLRVIEGGLSRTG